MTIMQKSRPFEWEELAALFKRGVFMQRGRTGAAFAFMLECWVKHRPAPAGPLSSAIFILFFIRQTSINAAFSEVMLRAH
ncbi:MAG TPA: hypothetical protein VFW84_15790 [Aquabacterium sp.]|nr:hypothetical protein [Aquabacterium sp.]HEX5374188.1 hypothetical protein [Aquabacterium sp.]